nr:RecName: Full=Uncharacterized protein SMPP18 [Nautilus macromphalus]
DSSVLTSEYPR